MGFISQQLFLIVVMTAATKTVAALSSGGWSDVAIKAAETMTVQFGERLQKSGVLELERPIQIIAQPIDTAQDALLAHDSKILHFQRHGQGYHNLLGDVWRGMGINVNLDSKNPSDNPFLMPDILDSPLTETGRQQCLARRSDVCLLNPQAVVVSPLLRAIQTAKLTFADFDGTVPWIAHEGCREEMGLLPCNKRRPLSEIRYDYPGIDFSQMQHEDDVLFDAYPDRRETAVEKSDRIYDFLTKFIRNRPEPEIAIVGHSAWLFTMLHAVMNCQGPDLGKWFLTSEVRSMRVTFVERP
jgi:broad specificity phosphatase PhoE